MSREPRDCLPSKPGVALCISRAPILYSRTGNGADNAEHLNRQLGMHNKVLRYLGDRIWKLRNACHLLPSVHLESPAPGGRLCLVEIIGERVLDAGGDLV